MSLRRGRRTKLIGGVAVVGLLAVGCGGDGAPQPVADRLQAALEATVRETGVPGASAAIVFPDGREWSGAAGRAVLHPPRPMTTRTALPFDSVTKIATAALALRLVERQRLSLDDPITRWFPRWRGDREATVRDLLGHTAGVRDAPLETVLRARDPARAVIDSAPKPGKRTSSAVYSNTGFVIAGAILARAAGEPVADAMRRELFDGAGLALQPGEPPRPPLAHSYWHPPGRAEPQDIHDGSSFLPARQFATIAGTAGALAGDVPSLARWGHRLLGGHLLTAGSMREMRRFHASDAWQGYGLGLARDSIDGHLMIGHEGAGFGSHSELWHLPPENLTVAVTWNDDVVGRDANALPALVRIALAGAN
jgi:D-alanyl-D-alanine carboxypeptidase